MDYATFKQTDKYNHAFGASEVGYIIYLETNTALKPIGRGSGFNVDDPIEQIPVEEWGVEVVKEFTDGKMTISGRIETFFIPAQEDMMPNTQNFRDKKYVVDMVCGGNVAAKVLADYSYTDANGVSYDLKADQVISLDGLILKRWRGVKFSGKGINHGQRGIIGVNVAFVASREYSGDEVANQIDTL
jgi:hypothetical protein